MYNLYLIQITRGVKYIILPLLVDAGAPGVVVEVDAFFIISISLPGAGIKHAGLYTHS
jgi:hypothetical protein